MTWFAPTLWDLLRPLRRAKPRRPKPRERPASAPRPDVRADGTPTMASRYDALIEEMKGLYGIRVRKWRQSTSGVAWQVFYEDGRVARLIESPRPRGPVSCAVFLHEVGHHAIGFSTYKPRCLEEYHAWRWAIEAMEARGLHVTPPVRRRMHAALHYAIQKARRRGLKRLPVELVPYLERPVPAREKGLFGEPTTDRSVAPSGSVASSASVASTSSTASSIHG